MPASPPTVSVLLPVRNGGTHLSEAMASLVSQSFTDFEVVVVDDGSTDETAEALGEWRSRDDRVRVLTQAPAGIVRALERGRSAARGRYLARMDADDIARPRRLELQLALLEAREELTGCGCLVEYFPLEAVREGARRYQRWINGAVTPEEISASMFVECPLAHPTFFLRADAVAEVGGYEDHGWPEDYDLVLRMAAAGHRFGKVPEVLLDWRERSDRLSRTHENYSATAFLACKVHYLRASLLANERAAVIWGAGPVGKGLARALIEAGTCVAAFVDLDPRKIGQEIHGAPVLDVDSAVVMKGPLHLGAVGQLGARERITTTLEDAGMVEIQDFISVA